MGPQYAVMRTPAPVPPGMTAAWIPAALKVFKFSELSTTVNLSRAIHNVSGEKGEFVALSCAALPDTQLESELISYKKGAFSEAKTDKSGRFTRAVDGTLFLDEIGDISAALQVKLLRVLQEREYEPLGATVTAKTNVRFIREFLRIYHLFGILNLSY